jgi:hypothetical protein
VKFELEFLILYEGVRTEILAQTKLFQQFGPHLGLRRVDRVNDSRHSNMKELRFDAADGVWRMAFALDPDRKAFS